MFKHRMFNFLWNLMDFINDFAHFFVLHFYALMQELFENVIPMDHEHFYLATPGVEFVLNTFLNSIDTIIQFSDV